MPVAAKGACHLGMTSSWNHYKGNVPGGIVFNSELLQIQ